MTAEQTIQPLDQILPNQGGVIHHLREEGLDPFILQDFWDQGFLPGTRIDVLEVFHSQKKLLVELSGVITIALPIELANRIEVLI